jgi:3-oxoacyl-[acyl-carrier protein] reductase
MGQLQGKVAIITGAGSGFGEGMATAYVREGATIIIADLNAEAGERVAKALGANAKAVACDVANADSVNAMVKACVDTFGVPDIVINNAGTTHKNQPMLNVDEKTFDRVRWTGVI